MMWFKTKRQRSLDKIARERMKRFGGDLKRGDRVRVKDPSGIFTESEWFVIIMDADGRIFTGGICLNTGNFNSIIRACDVVDWISAEEFTLRDLPWGARNPTDFFVDNVSGTRFDKATKSVHNP